jgi:hypothetical protein
MGRESPLPVGSGVGATPRRDPTAMTLAASNRRTVGHGGCRGEQASPPTEKSSHHFDDTWKACLLGGQSGVSRHRTHARVCACHRSMTAAFIIRDAICRACGAVRKRISRQMRCVRGPCSCDAQKGPQKSPHGRVAVRESQQMSMDNPIAPLSGNSQNSSRFLPHHEHSRMSLDVIGKWARSDSNRGPRDSLLPRRFRREWTISSPTWGAGRSSLSLSAT